MNAATWLVRRLKSGGVERIFALCGNGLDPFLDACFELDMPVIDVRNEQVASYMADTWGRLTGRLGVVAVSSGPGHVGRKSQRDGVSSASLPDGDRQREGPLRLDSAVPRLAVLRQDFGGSLGG